SGVSYGNKPNLFLYGPPGSGKTAIIKATAKTLEVPFVEMTASGLVKEQAYVQKILNRLLREANDDIRRAECGMVCLYGMEEITFDDFKFVQEELARVIEGEKFDAVGEGFTKKNRLIDTQNILFVCELTLDGKSRSKNSVSRQKYDGTSQNATDDEILGDLGLVRRLINQFPMIVSTEVLKQEELLEVLTHGDDSPVSLFERCCQDLGIQVELEQSALDVVTRECFQQGGDARLLKRLLNKILREDQGDWVSQKTVTVNGLIAEKALAPRIALKKNLNSNDGQENIVAISEEVEKNIVTISEEVEKKSSEQESAIAAYEQALLVHTQTDFPIKWAKTQNALGLAYWKRIRGDKAQNIEAAIAAYQQALLVRTQTDFPMEWAKTQNNLGVAYNDRIRGDKAQNIEAAIAACEQALLVHTQTDFPMDWAGTQHNLGMAYSNRIRGDKAQNMETAIAAYQQALQ
ncbi:MAG: tetratricopeptide repeat protein, partial [Trichodesmium sp. St2_bin2_1]|nr:tetratricopeptide repeat protein [Trichodesmium sp. St2_bin2_1]